jgi:protein phosphatase
MPGVSLSGATVPLVEVKARAQPRVQLRAAGASRRAPHHSENEDAWRIYAEAQQARGLFVVCDGVSTAGEGRAAAQLTCDRLAQFEPQREDQPSDALVQLVSEIDWELRGASRRARCTLAMAYVDGLEAHVYTVGDSPIYRLRGARMKQAGAERTGMFHRLRSFMGMGPSVAEVLTCDRWNLAPGDVLLLMSDGVLDALDEDELSDIWAATGSPRACVKAVLDEVARVGVDDDATLVVIEVREDVQKVSPAAPMDAPDPPSRLVWAPPEDEG